MINSKAVKLCGCSLHPVYCTRVTVGISYLPSLKPIVLFSSLAHAAVIRRLFSVDVGVQLRPCLSSTYST